MKLGSRTNAYLLRHEGAVGQYGIAAAYCAGIRPQAFVDIGANVGLVSIGVRLIFGGDIVIHAVEPDETSFKYLSENCEQMNIRTYRLALGSSPRAKLVSANRRLVSRQYAASDDGTGVDAFTLSAIAEKIRIRPSETAWKIDCEGGEFSLFDDPDGRKILSLSPFVCGEFHSCQLVSRRNRSRQAARDRCLKLIREMFPDASHDLTARQSWRFVSFNATRRKA